MEKSEPKQVIVWRDDLKVRTGKKMAQAAHASLKAILDLGNRSPTSICIPLEDPAVRQWLEGRFTKIALKVNSEHEMFDLYNKAKRAGLPCSLITDAGLTEFKGVPTNTCIAVGPADPVEVDKITGHLQLM